MFAAAIALTQLDNLFDKHPSWKTQGVQVAIYVAAFTKGASDGLTDLAIKAGAGK